MSNFEDSVEEFRTKSRLEAFPHLIEQLERLLHNVSVLGASACEKATQIWCGPKGVGKTALLSALCEKDRLHKLVKAAFPGHRCCRHLIGTYVDLRRGPFEFTLSQMLCLELSKNDMHLPHGLGEKLRALSTEAEDCSNLRIFKLNKLLSDHSVALLCVVDEAGKLYKQSTFTDDMSKAWVRDLLLLSALKHGPEANVSIGTVMCCSHARARQLFLLEPGEPRRPFGPDYKWAYRCTNWDCTKFNLLVCCQPSWTNPRLWSYFNACMGVIGIGIKQEDLECPMELLLACYLAQVGGPPTAGAAFHERHNFNTYGQASGAPSEVVAVSKQGDNQGHEGSSNPYINSLNKMLKPAEALQLVLAYTGGNHRALKEFVLHFFSFARIFDCVSHSFYRDEFVAALDTVAMSCGWDAATPLSDVDKRVLCGLLALLPDSRTNLNLDMHFDQRLFTVPKPALTKMLNPEDLDQAADSGVVLVTRTSVSLSSPATMIRFIEAGSDFGMLRWMLCPLDAFAERLELPVAQAIAQGAKELLPAGCVIRSQTIAVQETRDRVGQTLLPFRIGVCSMTVAPHTHFVSNARLLSLASKLGIALEDRPSEDIRMRVWKSIADQVLALVQEAGLCASGAAAAEEGYTAAEHSAVTWVLNVLMAAPVEREHRGLLNQHDCCFALKEYPDVYGGDVMLVYMPPTSQMSIVRVQVEVASPSSLKQEISFPMQRKSFDNARAAVNAAISGFAGSRAATTASFDAVQERNAGVALFMAAVRAASRLKHAGHTLNFSSAALAKQSVERIVAQMAVCSSVHCVAALATTHLLRQGDREHCQKYGITTMDCRDLYSHWGPCGLLARKLRAVPFWLPHRVVTSGAGVAAEDGEEFDY